MKAWVERREREEEEGREEEEEGEGGGRKAWALVRRDWRGEERWVVAWVMKALQAALSESSSCFLESTFFGEGGWVGGWVGEWAICRA